MNKIFEHNPYGDNSKRILETPPFFYSKHFAQKHNCDLAVPNGEGIGNVVIYTRLVEELALHLGKALKLLTAPINPEVGKIKAEEPYPIWKNNPYVKSILNAGEIDPEIMVKVNQEQDNFCQFNHFAENLCSVYNLKPRQLKPSLFLSLEEMQWAIETLSHLPRPLICLHPSGKSTVFKESPWYFDNWIKLIEEFDGMVSFIQLGKSDYDKKKLPVFNIETSIRQAMALIWASDFFVGFDSSPAHIATAFNKPSLVLWNILRKNPLEEPYQTGFGPASLLRWSYPQNRNIMLLGEKSNEILNLVYEFIMENIRSIYRQEKLLTFPFHE